MLDDIIIFTVEATKQFYSYFHRRRCSCGQMFKRTIMCMNMNKKYISERDRNTLCNLLWKHIRLPKGYLHQLKKNCITILVYSI